MAEWLKAPLSKSGIPLCGIKGSNPFLSASFYLYYCFKMIQSWWEMKQLYRFRRSYAITLLTASAKRSI